MKTPGDKLQKMSHTTAQRFKLQARLKPTQQHWRKARKADMLTVTPHVEVIVIVVVVVEEVVVTEVAVVELVVIIILLKMIIMILTIMTTKKTQTNHSTQ